MKVAQAHRMGLPRKDHEDLPIPKLSQPIQLMKKVLCFKVTWLGMLMLGFLVDQTPTHLSQCCPLFICITKCFMGNPLGFA